MLRAEQLHEKVLSRMDFMREPSDEELLEIIHSVLEESSKKKFIPLKEKAALGKELFNAFRKLDILQELIEDESITEIMINGKIACGTIVSELKDVSKSYKEAKMALDVGKNFYADRDVVAYNTLGIGRLIYQLPINLCQMFIEEIFGENVPTQLDEETLNTIDTFLENSLNVSETARQLYVHRNTLLYRLEKLQKATGLDIRVFDDALTLKIALMVVNYMKYLKNLEY